MKLSDLDPAFVRRLENWGLYYRDQYRPAESVTYRVCQEIATSRGSGMKDDYRESNPRPEMDVEDAMAMEKHWFMCSYRLTSQERALVRAYWASQADPRIVCRMLKIRFLSWEDRMCEATEKFRVAVRLLEFSDHASPPAALALHPSVRVD